MTQAIDIELNQVLRRTGHSTIGFETIGLETTGLESERQELIRAIAMSMNQRRKTRHGVVQEARFGVWVDLLRHLSAGEPASFIAHAHPRKLKAVPVPGRNQFTLELVLYLRGIRKSNRRFFPQGGFGRGPIPGDRRFGW